MSSLGKQGIQQVSQLCAQKAHYLAEKLNALEDVSVAFQHPYFNEFAIDLPIPAREVIHQLLEANLFAGVDLGSLYQGYENRLLVAVTEKRTKADLDQYVTALSSVLSSASSPV
jgi:glycine dehydrogenase subunit 1